jgi:hypothetical protein
MHVFSFSLPPIMYMIWGYQFLSFCICLFTHRLPLYMDYKLFAPIAFSLFENLDSCWKFIAHLNFEHNLCSQQVDLHSQLQIGNHGAGAS